MKQLIDKSAIIAEIERLHKKWEMGNYVHEKLISFLNTLEVKEVDLDAEFDKYCDNLYLIDLENEPYAELFECAKYFFELGLKAQKGK